MEKKKTTIYSFFLKNEVVLATAHANFNEKALNVPRMCINFSIGGPKFSCTSCTSIQSFVIHKA
uniref:Uncharacterized protein n=1 Tax=Arundo donax TaxID=35708 RepID=A0A0A9EYN4_ARUDO